MKPSLGVAIGRPRFNSTSFAVDLADIDRLRLVAGRDRQMLNTTGRPLRAGRCNKHRNLLREQGFHSELRVRFVDLAAANFTLPLLEFDLGETSCPPPNGSRRLWR
jgi:hypothetical protein